MFRVEMLPAYYGDCIWIEWGDEKEPSRLLIDAGLAGTYNAIVKRAGKSCRLELFCITHVDGDHVEGAVKLLANLPKELFIREVWFNGWDQVRGAARLGPVQGEKLGAAIMKVAHLPWNTRFKEKAVMVTKAGKLPRREFEGGLTLTVLSPRKEQLAILKPVWEKECAKAGLIPGKLKKAMEALQADRKLRPERLGPSVNVEELAGEAYEPDSSPANGSSIALLAEYDGKAVLLAADAHSEVLEKGILSLLKERHKKSLKLDAFKASHHGSRFNNSPKLIQMLDCPRWLFSTNGSRFHHPDRETIARILSSRTRADTELYFNYCSDYNCVWDSVRLQTQWHFKAYYPGSDKGGLAVQL